MMARQRYARIPERPRVVHENGEFKQIAQRIEDWVLGISADAPLQVAAVWGDRGSGKTSMLHTVLEQLANKVAERDPSPLVLPELTRDEHGSTPRPVDTRLLFEPNKLLTDDHILFHLLEFLDRRYDAFDKDHRKALEHLWRDEAQRESPDRFMAFHQEIAATHENLVEKAVEAFRDRASRTIKIRQSLHSIFRNIEDTERRLVLLIDDIDLRPDLGCSLLEILHAMFEHVPLTVLLAADQDLLAHGIGREFEKRAGRNLGFKVLAKQVHTEWRLPTPTKAYRSRWLMDGPAEMEGEPLRCERLWQDFRKPEKRSDAPPPAAQRALQADIVSRRRTEDDDGDRGDIEQSAQPGRADAKALFQDALPATYRGINRLYNRLATIIELHESDDEHAPLAQLQKRYQEHVGSAPRNVPAFLAIALAIDESFPDLRLFDAFEEDPQGLFDGLSANRQGWEQAVPENVAMIPVRHRLDLVDASTRHRAEPLLQRLGWLWHEIWRLSGHEAVGFPRFFLAIGVTGDAMEQSRSWWEDIFVEDESRGRIDLRGNRSLGQRPSPDEIRTLRRELEQRMQEYLERENLRIHALAPLPLLAWLGWRTQRAQGLAALSNIQGSPRFDLLSPPAKRPRFEAGHKYLHRLEYRESSSAEDAGIVLDVRPSPDTSDAPLLFVTQGGESVDLPNYCKLYLATEIWNDRQVEEVIHDVTYEIDRLRNEKNARRIHLAFACSGALAILVGRFLHPYQPIGLYEHDPSPGGSPRYVHVIDLPDVPASDRPSAT